MTKEFLKLSEEEKQTMLEAPVLIAILIAGADGNLEEKEISWAKKISGFRTKKEDSLLNEYYFEVGKIFDGVYERLTDELPEGTSKRSHEIIHRLEELNRILPKLDHTFSQEFYKELKSFARQVARSSGGTLGFGAVSEEERKYIDLEMIKI